jgi:PiT family inorganic phosphate transporter
MAAATTAGCGRIIRILGHRVVNLHPVHGFAAVLLAAGHLDIPGSTSRAITTSITRVGCAKGFKALKFSVVERSPWAGMLTIPTSGRVACGWVCAARALGFLSSAVRPNDVFSR